MAANTTEIVPDIEPELETENDDGISLPTEWFNIIITALVPILGFTGIIIYSFATVGGNAAWAVIGKLLLLSLAALIFGGIFGFLFGIPKTLQSNNTATDTTKYVINTNLEQISDWLTKIIVGIGLIQIREVPKYLNAVHTYLQNNWGSTTLKDIGSVSVCVLCYFLFLGFLLVYLYTRINLTALLKKYGDD